MSCRCCECGDPTGCDEILCSRCLIEALNNDKEKQENKEGLPSADGSN